MALVRDTDAAVRRSTGRIGDSGPRRYRSHNSSGAANGFGCEPQNEFVHEHLELRSRDCPDAYRPQPRRKVHSKAISPMTPMA